MLADMNLRLPQFNLLLASMSAARVMYLADG